MVRSGAIDIIVIDSVAALVPRAEIEGEMGDSHEPITALKGIGPKKKADFANLNIITIGDLLNRFPRQGCYMIKWWKLPWRQMTIV